MTYVLVFVAMTLLDYVFAEYTKACADRRNLWASSTAAAIILLTGFVTSSYVNNPWLLLPAAAGAFAGTWLSIKFGK